jgi:hypothetical protein
MREKILTVHLKERTNDLNQLEAEFGQEEKGLEEEIITLKMHLEDVNVLNLHKIYLARKHYTFSERNLERRRIRERMEEFSLTIVNNE